MPHSLIRFGGEPKWTLRDRILALALQLYEDGLCPGCGQPASRAHNPDMEGYYVASTTRCWACAARETQAADQQGHGVLVGVVDESYLEGYEPRLPLAGVEQAPGHGSDAGQADQH